MTRIKRARRRRGCLGTTAALALALALPAAAAAAPTRPPAGFPSLPQHVDSAHFVVHYSTSTATPATAAAESGYAETAYADLVTQWGYPPPMNDGDAKTDIYMFDAGFGPAAGPDENTDQTTGFIIMPPANATGVYPVAHEFFHVIQFGIYHQEQGWLVESTAEWAGQNVVVAHGGTAPPNWYVQPWTPLDCMSGCADGGGGYRGSIFMEYLDERFGMTIVRDVFQRAAALGAGNHQQHSLQALGDAIGARGSTLPDAFVDFVTAATAGLIDRPGVTNHRPAARELIMGEAPAWATLGIKLDHLAFTGVFVHGENGAPCTPQTLGLNVQLPAGVPSRPAFVLWPGGSADKVIPLAISGSTASAQIPWSACAAGTLALANGSTTANAQPFPVTVTISPRSLDSGPGTGSDGSEPGDTTTRPRQLTFSLKAAARGKIVLTVVARRPGKLSVKATTTAGRRKLTYSSRTLTLKRAGRVKLTLSPASAAKRALVKAKKLRVSVAVKFAPRTGSVRTYKKSVTVGDAR